MKLEKVKKRIGFDLDGVLADHKENKLKIVKDLGYSINPERAHKVYLKKNMKRGDYKKLKERLYEEESLSAGVMKGASQLLENIKNAGYDFFVISKRKSGRSYAREWLGGNLNFSDKNIFFVNKDNEKDKVAQQLGLEFFLDDTLAVLEFMSPNINRFLFDEFFVYEDEELGDIKVVHSFDEFLKEIEKL